MLRRTRCHSFENSNTGPCPKAHRSTVWSLWESWMTRRGILVLLLGCMDYDTVADDHPSASPGVCGLPASPLCLSQCWTWGVCTMTQSGKAEPSSQCFSWGVWTASFTFVSIPVLLLGSVGCQLHLCAYPSVEPGVYGLWHSQERLVRWSYWQSQSARVLKMSSMSTPAFFLGCRDIETRFAFHAQIWLGCYTISAEGSVSTTWGLRSFEKGSL